jgi:hypothetical protein
MQIRGHSAQEFPDCILRKARKGPPIEGNFPMLSLTKAARSSRKVQDFADSSSADRNDRLGGDLFLVAEDAPVRTTLVGNKERYD